MVLNLRIVFIFLNLLLLSSCMFKHPTYEYKFSRDTGSSFNTIYSFEKEGMYFSVETIIHDYGQTDRCCGEDEYDMQAMINFDTLMQDPSDNIGRSNFEYYNPIINLMIDDKIISVVSNNDVSDRYETYFNFEEMPFEKDLEGTVAASVTASNIHTGEVQSFNIHEKIICERDFVAFIPFGP